MKTLLFVMLISFVSNIYAQSGNIEGVSFYCFNEAFRDMEIEIMTPNGQVFKDFWRIEEYNGMGMAVMKIINFPVDGRNCQVKLFFRNASGDTCKFNLLLNNCDYNGHPLYVMISSETLAPAIISNWGPIQEGLRLISEWYYPQDDIIINPQVKKETKLSITNYYAELKKQTNKKRVINLIR